MCKLLILHGEIKLADVLLSTLIFILMNRNDISDVSVLNIKTGEIEMKSRALKFEEYMFSVSKIVNIRSLLCYYNCIEYVFEKWFGLGTLYVTQFVIRFYTIIQDM